MIADVDRALEKLFQIELGDPLPFDLSFAVPDKGFTPVSQTKNTLNCYLYDIREDRELRQTAPRFHRTAAGFVEKEYPPPRIKLSYCITAWSPLLMGPAVPPALDEHSLLSQILKTLLKHPTLPEAALVGLLTGQQPPLPTTAVLPDGIKNNSDFWNAIGGQLRPALEYTVTISLDYQLKFTGPLVHAVNVTFDGGDSFWVVGGTVYDSSTPTKVVPDAWVRVVETGKIYTSDADGRYRIDRITEGTYNLVVRATGFKEGTRTIHVPLMVGNYDVGLSL